METARKDKRIYTKRTKQQRLDLLKAKLDNLEAFHAKQALRIETLKTKVSGNPVTP